MLNITQNKTKQNQPTKKEEAYTQIQQCWLVKKQNQPFICRLFLFSSLVIVLLEALWQL